MKCPICKKLVEEPRAGVPVGSFPFCSERCKLIDLGRWLDGKYQIPVVVSDDDDASDDLPPAPPGANRGEGLRG